MKFSGMIVCLLSSGCLIGSAQNPPGGQPQPVPPQPQPVNVPMAFITSERVVYAEGQPIDLTFAVAAPKTGTLIPRFKIEKEDGEIAAAKLVNGKYFWQTAGTSIHSVTRPGAINPVTDAQEFAGAMRQYVETIADLRAWYEMDEPDFYRVSFDGEWLNEGQSHSVTSNTILVKIGTGAAGAMGAPNGGAIEPQIIPLAEIWALNMPGTQPMDTSRNANNAYFAPEGVYLREIQRAALDGNDDLNSPARQGFAVLGTGMNALLRAHAVLAQNQSTQTSFHVGDTVSIVYFSKLFEYYVHIDRVTQHGSVIEISYKLVTHMTDEATSHFALIPVTLTDPGVMRVEIRTILDENLLRKDLSRYMDCIRPRPFQFEVAE